MGDKPMDMNSLTPAPGSRRKGRYLGRGRSSKRGKTCGRGQKGQFSRTGSDRRPGFAGGNLPLVLRMPKRGFVYPFRIDYRVVNIADLEGVFSANEAVTPDSLVEKGVLRTARPAVKILGGGEIKTALHVEAHAFSESAKKKIEAAGGTCAVVTAGRKAD